MNLSDSALVLFSGGQDSTVCLAWAVELEVRPALRSALAAQSERWRARLGDDHMVRIDSLAEISDTALTRDVAIEMSASGLPTIVLFGPETPKLYQPLGTSRAIYAGLACSPCVSAHNHRKTACTDNVCMQAIAVDEVYAAVAEVLSAPRQTAAPPQRPPHATAP